VYLSQEPETPENKELLDLVMNRKGLFNAGGDKPLTKFYARKRGLQAQVLLDIAWAELHGHKRWEELDKEGRKKYQYTDEHGNVVYHRPNDVYEAAGYTPEEVGTREALTAPLWVARIGEGTYVTHFKGKKLAKPERVKTWAEKNQVRINSDPEIAFGITKQKPYHVHKVIKKTGKVIDYDVKDPHKWRLYWKKSAGDVRGKKRAGRTIRWIGE
jgi:hypothetical protein